MGLLHNLGAFFLRQERKGAHGLRILRQGKAKTKGEIVFIHQIHPALSQILQICRRNVVFHVVPGQIVVEHRVDLGNRLLFFLLPFILSGLIFLLFRHEDHLKHRIPPEKIKYVRTKNVRTYSFFQRLLSARPVLRRAWASRRSPSRTSLPLINTFSMPKGLP